MWKGYRSNGRRKKRPHFVKPPMFDSAKDSKPSYREWIKILQHFLESHINTCNWDKNIIITIGRFMMGTTRDWFSTQDEQMWKLWIGNNYKSFIESMDL